MTENTVPPYWVQREPEKYESVSRACNATDRQKFRDYVLMERGVFRNARIRFKVTALKPLPTPVTEFHAALLFRKNSQHYLGVELGGWSSKYSAFSRSDAGFQWQTSGAADAIELERPYEFVIEIRGGFLREFMVDKEVVLQPLSLRDSLRSTLRTGLLGLYAHDCTHASVELMKVEQLPQRCFVITNIDGVYTDQRRKQFESVLGPRGDLEFQDSRDLTREYLLMEKIRRTIVEADLVIADLGGGRKPRPNVYYEIGIAHCVGAPVIHIGPDECAFHDPQMIPSDLKQQFFILEHEIGRKLGDTVKAILDTPEGDFRYL